MITRLLRCGIVALAFLMSVPAPTSAQSDEVVALFERGLDAYRLANYEEAERLFAQAHALEPLADLSYNHARTLELLGRFGEAADIYARFLEEAPDAEDRDIIQTRIQNLRERQAREAVEPRRVAERAPVDVEEPSEEETRVNGPSLVGPLVLMGGGLVIGAGGVISGLSASSAHDEALDPATTQADADAANRRATTLARTTTALLVVGGAAIAAGATWLVIKLVRGPGDDAVSLRIAPTRIALEGMF